MFQVIASGIIAFGILLITNHLSKKRIITGELSRKVPHIVSSIMVAFWPLFISMQMIALLSLMFIVVVWVVLRLNLFSHARNVKRLSHGEYFFVAGFGLAALLNPPGWIFAVALLNVGLADASAALVGTKHGKYTKTVFGQKKSLEGSLAFIATSIIILTTFFIVTPLSMQHAALVITILPVFAAAVEFISPYGIDNLLVPTVITTVLMYSQTM